MMLDSLSYGIGLFLKNTTEGAFFRYAGKSKAVC